MTLTERLRRMIKLEKKMSGKTAYWIVYNTETRKSVDFSTKEKAIKCYELLSKPIMEGK